MADYSGLSSTQKGAVMLKMDFRDTVKLIDRATSKGPMIAGMMLYKWNLKMLKETLRITPVDTGNLRASGHVTNPVVNGTVVSTEIVFGGDSAPYAFIVHERLDVYHRPPTQAKFLEATYKRFEKDVWDDINRTLRRAMYSGTGFISGNA